MLSKFLEKVKIYQSEIVLGLAVSLISIISFQSGKIYTAHRMQTPVEIREGRAVLITDKKPEAVKSKDTPSKNQSNTQVVASKNSDKYHFSWCTGARRIATANKIYFASAAEAEKAGYTLAGNCKP